MKEIGGYFELGHFRGQEYHKRAIAVNSARNALIYLARVKKIKKIYIPKFLCDSIYKVCEREGISYEYYSLNKNLEPIFERNLGANEYIFIVNYYGQFNKSRIKKLKTLYRNIIIDNTQAFFSKPLKGVDTIYSCRKFFGVPDGGYLFSDVKLDLELSKDKSRERFAHLLGRYEENANAYYANFREAEELFKEKELCYMSDLTHNLLRGIHYKDTIKIRNRNYDYLQKKLKSYNKIHFNKPRGPYCYPLYLSNGLEVKRRLAEKKIYVATLWPNVLELENSLEKDLAENILPLPCDQRYTLEEMKIIVQEVLTCIN